MNVVSMSDDLLLLQNAGEDPCVSIIMPLQTDLAVVRHTLESIITKTEQLLWSGYEPAVVKKIMVSIRQLADSVPDAGSGQGIGLFVSSRITLHTRFPFPVVENIYIGGRFDVRDLQYKMSFPCPYFLLLLTKNECRLMEGQWDQLQVVNDHHFPFKNNDEYEYEKPTGNSSGSGRSHLKIIERDRTHLEQVRMKAFFRKADGLLDDYLDTDTPLVLCGVREELALFMSVSRHHGNIIGTVAGSHLHDNTMKLTELAWPVVCSYQEKTMVQSVRELGEKSGIGRVEAGIRNVWKAAKENRCLQLVVEKDYRPTGYLTAKAGHLYLHPPIHPATVMKDVAGDIIRDVLLQNGTVIQVTNGMLGDYGQVACITRF